MPSHDASLAGGWRISSADGCHAADFPVPGDVHSALVAAQIIPHPYLGRNEYDCRWVAEEDWIARRTFEFRKTGNGRWSLDIDYLDTTAEVRINGALVLNAANSFRRYRTDVTAQLAEGLNEIEIVFRSKVKRAAELQARSCVETLDVAEEEEQKEETRKKRREMRERKNKQDVNAYESMNELKTIA